MHLLKYTAFIALVAIVVWGCETTLDVSLPYEHRLVLNSFFGSKTDTLLNLSRTLPVNEIATRNRLGVAGAEVTLRVGSRTYQLQPTEDPIIYRFPQYDSTWAGQQVNIHVKADGLDASASTTIPEVPQIVYVRLVERDEWTKKYIVGIRVPENIAIWTIAHFLHRPIHDHTLDATPMDHYFPVYSNRHGKDILEVEAVAENYSFEPGQQDSVLIKVVVAASDFLLFKSSHTGYGDSDTWGGLSGNNPPFNIQGNGIGLFVGSSSVEIKVP